MNSKWIANFRTTVEVEAETRSEAKDKAWVEWADNAQRLGMGSHTTSFRLRKKGVDE